MLWGRKRCIVLPQQITALYVSIPLAVWASISDRNTLWWLPSLVKTEPQMKLEDSYMASLVISWCSWVTLASDESSAATSCWGWHSPSQARAGGSSLGQHTQLQDKAELLCLWQTCLERSTGSTSSRQAGARIAVLASLWPFRGFSTAVLQKLIKGM